MEKRWSLQNKKVLITGATKGIATVSLKHGKPVAFGLLTTDTIEQAIERAGTKAGNKGFEAMVTVIELLQLYTEIGE